MNNSKDIDLIKGVIENIANYDYSENKLHYEYYSNFLDGFYNKCLKTSTSEMMAKRKINMNNIKNISIIENDKIPKITHRMWITGNDIPYEIPIEKLKTYSEYLEKFNDYKNFFWCLNKSNIPNTVRYLEENTSVIINEINIEELYGKDIIKRYLLENRYTSVSDIIRFNLLYSYGGIYSDFGVYLKINLDNLLFVDYILGNEGICIGTTFMACKEKSTILYKICNFIENMDKITLETRKISDGIVVPPWTSLGLLTCISDYYLDTNSEILLPINYINDSFVSVNHMGSWLTDDSNKNFGQPNFYNNPITIDTYFTNKYNESELDDSFILTM